MTQISLAFVVIIKKRIQKHDMIRVSQKFNSKNKNRKRN